MSCKVFIRLVDATQGNVRDKVSQDWSFNGTILILSWTSQSRAVCQSHRPTCENQIYLTSLNFLDSSLFFHHSARFSHFFYFCNFPISHFQLFHISPISSFFGIVLCLSPLFLLSDSRFLITFEFFDFVLHSLLQHFVSSHNG